MDFRITATFTDSLGRVIGGGYTLDFATQEPGVGA